LFFFFVSSHPISRGVSSLYLPHPFLSVCPMPLPDPSPLPTPGFFFARSVYLTLQALCVPSWAGDLIAPLPFEPLTFLFFSSFLPRGSSAPTFLIPPPSHSQPPFLQTDGHRFSHCVESINFTATNSHHLSELFETPLSGVCVFSFPFQIAPKL